MNAAVHGCFALTKELFELVQLEAGEEARDGKIERIEALLEKREQLIKEIKPPFTQEEQELGRQITEWNRVIDERLKALFSQIQGDLKGLKAKKDSMPKYTNPYGALQSSSVYYDKKN